MEFRPLNEQDAPAFTSTAHLIGYVSAQGSPLRRIKHVLNVVIEILPEYAYR
jgi:hypothetical protein